MEDMNRTPKNFIFYRASWEAVGFSEGWSDTPREREQYIPCEIYGST